MLRLAAASAPLPAPGVLAADPWLAVDVPAAPKMSAEQREACEKERLRAMTPPVDPNRTYLRAIWGVQIHARRPTASKPSSSGFEESLARW